MAEAAQYPTSVTTQLYEVVARKSTTLTADVDSLNTNLAVASTSGFPTYSFISVNNETMLATVLDGTNFTVSRAYAGTAASHNEGDDVKLVVAAASINRIRLETMAIQDFVGKSGDTRTTTLYYKLHNLGSFTQSGSTMVANLNAQYIGGSTEGQLSVNNSAKLTNINGASIAENDYDFMAYDLNLNNDNPATLITIDGSSVNPVNQKVEFGNTDEADLPPLVIPRTWNSGSVVWSIWYCSSTSGSTFDLGIRGCSNAAGNSWGWGTLGTPVYFGTLTCGDIGIIGYTEKTIAAASLKLGKSKIMTLRVLGGTVCAVQLIKTGLRWSKG